MAGAAPRLGWTGGGGFSFGGALVSDELKGIAVDRHRNRKYSIAYPTTHTMAKTLPTRADLAGVG